MCSMFVCIIRCQMIFFLFSFSFFFFAKEVYDHIYVKHFTLAAIRHMLTNPFDVMWNKALDKLFINMYISCCCWSAVTLWILFYIKIMLRCNIKVKLCLTYGHELCAYILFLLIMYAFEMLNKIVNWWLSVNAKSFVGTISFFG